MNILITGSTGFIGSALVPLLLGQGHKIIAVTRRSATSSPKVTYIPAPSPDELFSPAIIAKTDAIINLAGENIAGSRWTDDVKAAIRSSRLDITKQLAASIKRNQAQNLRFPRVLISASAVGYYGTSLTEQFTEQQPAGTGFLASVCKDWEEAALSASDAGVRVALLRFGVILGPGGALKRMALPFQFGFGGLVGNGKQWCSWVHRDDAVAAINYALTQPLSGPYNVVSPRPVTMKDFTVELSVALGKPAWTKLPSWTVRLLLGEMADELLLNGQKALPEQLQAAGFSFAYPSLEAALATIYRQ